MLTVAKILFSRRASKHTLTGNGRFLHSNFSVSDSPYWVSAYSDKRLPCFCLQMDAPVLAKKYQGGALQSGHGHGNATWQPQGVWIFCRSKSGRRFLGRVPCHSSRNTLKLLSLQHFDASTSNYCVELQESLFVLVSPSQNLWIVQWCKQNEYRRS